MTEATTIPKESEHEKVTRYRLEQLIHYGYDTEDAILIAARHDVDLHHATDLIAQGCTSDIAKRILI